MDGWNTHQFTMGDDKDLNGVWRPQCSPRLPLLTVCNRTRSASSNQMGLLLRMGFELAVSSPELVELVENP